VKETSLENFPAASGFAYVDGSGHVARYTAGTELSTSTNGPTFTMDPATNYTLTMGSATIGPASTLTANSLRVKGGGTLDLSGKTVSLTSGGLIIDSTAQVAFDNGKLGAPDAELLIHKAGSGFLVFGPNLTMSGGTGSVVLDGDGGGAFTWFQGNTSTFSGGVRLHGGIITSVSASTISNGNTLVSGPFGTGTLTLGGGGYLNAVNVPVRLDNPVNLAGDFNFSLGTSTLTLGGPMTLTGGTHTINGVNFAGTIGDGGHGYGLILKNGVAVLGGASTYTGLTQVNSATLLVNGSIPGSVEANAGSVGGSGTIGGDLKFISGSGSNTLSPGNNNAGTLTVNGNLGVGGSSAQFELAGSNNYDRVKVGGSAAVSGTLSLSLTNGFIPSFGDTFHILTAASRTGTFSQVTGTTSPSAPGVRFIVSYTPTEVLVSAPLPGDANLDNVVGPGDLNLLAINFGKSGQTWATGDFTGDGVVGAGDLNLLASYFGRSVAGASISLSASDVEALQAFAAANVPEPAGFAAGAASLGILGMWRRRRRNGIATFSAALGVEEQ
jgi:fibronectin-binding autotransporter adhesin